MYCARGGASMLHQHLGAVDERHLVGERAEPVDAVDERGDLRVRAELAELLVAAVHVADHRVRGDDALAVEADHQAQRAVGRGVLRARGSGSCRRCRAPRPRPRRPGGAARPARSRSPASCVVRRWLLASRSCLHLRVGSSLPASSSPGIGSTSTRPGHGFTSPREQREVLAQRVALELRRRYRWRRLGWPSKTIPYISQHSRSCQSAPG